MNESCQTGRITSVAAAVVYVDCEEYSATACFAWKIGYSVEREGVSERGFNRKTSFAELLAIILYFPRFLCCNIIIWVGRIPLLFVGWLRKGN